MKEGMGEESNKVNMFAIYYKHVGNSQKLNQNKEKTTS